MNKIIEELKGRGVQLLEMTDQLSDTVLLIRVEEGGSYRFMYGNEAFFKDTGWVKSETEGELVKSLMPEEMYKFLEAKYGEVVTSKKKVEYENTSTFNDQEQSFRVSLLPLVDNTMQVNWIVGISKNVTDFIKQKKELEEKIVELEEVVSIMVGREKRMAELKSDIDKLKEGK